MPNTYLELIPYFQDTTPIQNFEEFIELLPPLSKYKLFHQEHYQFLIQTNSNKIHFLLRSPSKHKEEVQNLLYSKYTNLKIQTYSLKPNFNWIHLHTSSNNPELQLKNYQEFQSDTLNPILNNIQNSELIKIQFKPINNTFSKNGKTLPLFKTKISLGYSRQTPSKLIRVLTRLAE